MWQLPPIYDSIVMDKSHLDGRPDFAPSHWNQHFKIFYLTEKMRSHNDIEFSNLCDRVAKGKITEKDEQYLRSRIRSTASENSNEKFQKWQPFNNCNNQQEKRFDKMIGDGGIEEVKQLLEMKYDPNSSIMKAIGVREISKYLNNELTLQEASDLAKQKTRNYIKRQITWIKGNNITQNCSIKKYL